MLEFLNIDNKSTYLHILFNSIIWNHKHVPENWRDHRRTGTHKHTETVLRYFNWHGCLSQSEERVTLVNSLVTPSLSWVHKHLLSSDWERQPCQLKYLNTVSMCLCVPVLLWSLQFLVRVFTFPSLNLWFSYFGAFLSSWSKYTISSFKCSNSKYRKNKRENSYLNLLSTYELMWLQ